MAILQTNPQVLIFKMDDDGNFEQLGELIEYDGINWPDNYCGYADWALYTLPTNNSVELLKEGNIVWCGGETAGIIEIIDYRLDKSGQRQLNVRGRTLELLLVDRIVWGTYYRATTAASIVLYDLVNRNCINTTNINRKIPFLVNSNINIGIGNIITIQRTGTNLYDVLHEIANGTGLGFRIVFDPINKSITFKVLQGIDRSINQNVNPVIEFSRDIESILSSNYYYNNQLYKNVGLVMGEDSGNTRKSQVAGEINSKGFKRKEVFVDARDIQSEIVNDQGEIVVIPDDQYNQSLIERGEERLANMKVTENYNAIARVYGQTYIVFGTDYFVGDIVTITDSDIGRQISQRIVRADESISRGNYNLNLIFGDDYPTIQEKISRGIVKEA